jgi:hypothetical protein
MEILKTPWKDRFLELVQDSNRSIKITSPYIKASVCNEMLSAKKSSSKLGVVTFLNLKSVYSGALDIEALENIVSQGQLYNYSNLHSKIYIFDDKKAIVTSGNLTNGGMLNNYEYGLYIDDSHLIKRISSDFNSMVKCEDTLQIELRHLSKSKAIIENYPNARRVEFPDLNFDEIEDSNEVLYNAEDAILKSLKGWTKDVFLCLLEIPSDEFVLSELVQFESRLQILYPNNNTVPHQIRKQLQNLRKFGLLKFYGNGRYKKLWT